MKKFCKIAKSGGDSPWSWLLPFVLSITYLFIEYFVNQQLVNYVESNNILSKQQFGFRKKRSTAQPLQCIRRVAEAGEIGRAEAEKRRLIIEAMGRDSANLVLRRNLTEEVLRYKGIEATLKLAESSNSKVVVVGGGDDGLPLILNP